MRAPSHRQLQYTCTFLQVSFQAILRALDTSAQHRPSGACAHNSSPCWLDAQLITMLLREIRQARSDAAGLSQTSEALDSAIHHTGLLLAQCPGALNRQLCEHHLQAIIVPLQHAVQLLDLPSKPPRTPATRRNILKRWRNT